MKNFSQTCSKAVGPGFLERQLQPTYQQKTPARLHARTVWQMQESHALLCNPIIRCVTQQLNSEERFSKLLSQTSSKGPRSRRMQRFPGRRRRHNSTLVNSFVHKSTVDGKPLGQPSIEHCHWTVHFSICRMLTSMHGCPKDSSELSGRESLPDPRT